MKYQEIWGGCHYVNSIKRDSVCVRPFNILVYHLLEFNTCKPLIPGILMEEVKRDTKRRIHTIYLVMETQWINQVEITRSV